MDKYRINELRVLNKSKLRVSRLIKRIQSFLVLLKFLKYLTYFIIIIGIIWMDNWFFLGLVIIGYLLVVLILESIFNSKLNGYRKIMIKVDSKIFQIHKL